jgi:hypothetical protein
MFCDHDISDHVNLAIVNGDGTIILLPGADSYPKSVMTSVPSTVRKERTFQFSRAALYSPNIAGTIFKLAKFRKINMYLLLKLNLSGAGGAKMSCASANASGSGFLSAKPSGSGKPSGSAHDSAYDSSKPSGSESGKPSGSGKVSCSSKTSGPASASAKSPKILPVTVFYVDVRQPSRLPFSPIHVDEMVRMGNCVLDVDFADMSEYAFKSLIKTNPTFGEVFSSEGKGYYLYGLKRLYSKILIPTSFHNKNYPGSAARTSICKGKFLSVSPSARNDEEKAAYLSLVTINGVMILDEDSDQDFPIVAAQSSPHLVRYLPYSQLLRFLPQWLLRES